MIDAHTFHRNVCRVNANNERTVTVPGTLLSRKYVDDHPRNFRETWHGIFVTFAREIRSARGTVK